ncbi:MAG TPA: class I SAM-dependent methyltransferase [Candidatus Nanoarchaeia archaeon]|nr:class I SAM-dependent methyltransferase [Candidatus Nanoarchaeia archaeon]
MGQLMNIITPLHQKTTRDYLSRMNDDKVACMKIARKYDLDYWDGSRRTGYGGYKYDGRWEVVARAIIEAYRLPGDAKILDIGCGKGFLLYELKRLLPKATITGLDISEYAVNNAKPEIKENILVHKAQAHYPFPTQEFDLVLSIMALHNMALPDLQKALQEIERVGKNKFITVESYRNEKELFNLQCWAFTCESFFSPESWVWIFEHFGYHGDYEFMYFE